MTYPGHNPHQQVVVHAQPSNGLGTAGFIVSLIGLVLTAGILCPVGLLLSLIGLFRRPRGFAIAGTILGAIGTMIPVVLFLLFGAALFSSVACLSAFSGAIAVETKTITALNDADMRIQQYYTDNHALPSDFDGNNLIDAIRDGNARRLRYFQVSPTTYEIRSSGNDGRFGNADDRVKNSIAGAPAATLPAPRAPAPSVEPE